eukprot:4671053-Pyramimonas_sp.AAC.1
MPGRIGREKRFSPAQQLAATIGGCDQVAQRHEALGVWAVVRFSRLLDLLVVDALHRLSLIHISEPTRPEPI